MTKKLVTEKTNKRRLETTNMRTVEAFKGLKTGSGLIEASTIKRQVFISQEREPKCRWFIQLLRSPRAPVIFPGGPAMIWQVCDCVCTIDVARVTLNMCNDV